MLCLSSFELYSRWVPLKLVCKMKTKDEDKPKKKDLYIKCENGGYY